jgi:uncharacterized protein YuzE
MEPKLTLRYDRDGDILYMDTVNPYPEQESEELDDGIVVRLNPHTDEIENLEILWFQERLSRDAPVELPLTAILNLGQRGRGRPEVRIRSDAGLKR